MERLKEYRCHKVVRAAKILDVRLSPITALLLDPGDGGEPFLHEVPGEFMGRHLPNAGGYLVIYADGYRSYSPVQAFEDGYSLMSDVAKLIRDGESAEKVLRKSAKTEKG